MGYAESNQMLQLPKGFAELFRASGDSGSVEILSRAVCEIIDDNKLPFFPNFTDHGRKHIQRVISTQRDLVPSDVLESSILQPPDIAVLVCATLLHDLAMHLREPGFFALVSGRSGHRPVRWFDSSHENREADKEWKDLWEEFLAEASRFGDRQLINIFWQPAANATDWRPRRPPNQITDWTDLDRLLIGEFIRRHHCRLAHEIAVYGFPGLPRGTRPGHFPVLADEMPDLGELAGVVARSHGLELRTCADYLAYQYPGDLRPNSTLPLFLMALLRVADYLQIDSDRAPFTLLQLRQPQSPVSLAEWNKHGAVAHISLSHQDPQAVYINLKNTHSLRTHLQLAELLEGLQSEMDSSAAIISEVYGRANTEGFDKLRLAKSRVRTNINHPALVNSLPYVPVKSTFTADPHLLTLLVEPLYGDYAEIGIRELLQNATDAVNEVRLYSRDHRIDLIDVEFPNQDWDILIELVQQDNEDWLFVIRDKGIGMTARTVQDYFLKAGASFRNSEAWTKEFADQHGQSRVLRSGRFGIGVFAAFLLGDKISVETRHISESTGYAFTASRHTDLIELRRRGLPVGTTIEIPVRPEKAHALQTGDCWDWYTFLEPRVLRQIRYRDGRCQTLRQSYAVPDPNAAQLPNEWRLLHVPGYDHVMWNNHGIGGELICNGIRIREIQEEQTEYSPADMPKLKRHGFSTRNDYRLVKRNPELQFNPPTTAIFDPDGNLPLSLKRDQLLSRYLPFDDALSEDILLDFLAFSLTSAPSQPLWQSDYCSSAYSKGYPLVFNPEGTWFCTNMGAAPRDPFLMSQIGYSKALLVGEIGVDMLHETACASWPIDALIPDGAIGCDLSYTRLDLDYFSEEINWDHGLQSLLGIGRVDERRIIHMRRDIDPSPRSTRLLFRTTDGLSRIKNLKSSNHISGPTELGRMNLETIFELTMGEVKKCEMDLECIIRKYTRIDSYWRDVIPYAMEISYGEPSKISEPTQIGNIWNEYLQVPLIPFDPRERRALLARANGHTRLAYHLERWRRSG